MRHTRRGHECQASAHALATAIVGFASIALGTSGCVSTALLSEAGQCSPSVTATLKPHDGATTTTLEDGDLDGAPLVQADDLVLILGGQQANASVGQTPQKQNLSLTLSVQVAQDRSVRGDKWSDVEVPGDWTNPNGFVARVGDIGAPDDRLVKFSVTADSAASCHYFVRVRVPGQWSGITAPVLLRATGNAGAFQLDNLAPSVATGYRWNLRYPNFSFVAANAIVTIFSLPSEANQPRTYSLAAGLAFDLAGWLQVGGSYQFKNHKTYLIFGLRPEMLAALFGATEGGQ